MSGENVTTPEVLPETGQAVVLRFDGAETVVWWGVGANDRDVVAAHGGRLLTWDSVEACVKFASDADWEVDWDAGITSDQATVRDFTPAQRRLAGETTTSQPHSALDLWNFATDVAHTLGLPFNDSGRMADECHEKLTKAVVPQAFGLSEYQLRWTSAELNVVRRIVDDAVHLVRVATGR